MDMIEQHRCLRCGGELTREETRFSCKYCGSHYDIQRAEAHTEAMRSLFDEAKWEMVSNLRRMLFDAVTAEYISREEVRRACEELKKHLPSDFCANFYEIAVGNQIQALCRAIDGIDVLKEADHIDTIICFLVKSLSADADYLLQLNLLVERAFKARDLVRYERYSTMISEQAKRINQGVYETSLPRDVFVAYSGKDMPLVEDLVCELETQGLSCFVAARNLRHGQGAVENYNTALQEAMDNCRVVVFVSTPNSRNFSCDALRVELAYIKKGDVARAPAEYQSHYGRIPLEYKKPRIQYRVGQTEQAGGNAADILVDEFFEGYEWAYTPREVTTRVMKLLMDGPAVGGEHTTGQSDRQTHRQESDQQTHTDAGSHTEAHTIAEDASALFLQAKRFVAEGSKTVLSSAAGKLSTATENARRNATLREAQELIAHGTKESLSAAIQKLQPIANYRNAPQLMGEAQRKLQAILTKERQKELRRQEKARRAARPPKYQSKGRYVASNVFMTILFVLLVAITGPLLLVSIAGIFIDSDPTIGVVMTVFVVVPAFFGTWGIFRKKAQNKRAIRYLENN